MKMTLKCQTQHKSKRCSTHYKKLQISVTNLKKHWKKSNVAFPFIGEILKYWHSNHQFQPSLFSYGFKNTYIQMREKYIYTFSSLFVSLFKFYRSYSNIDILRGQAVLNKTTHLHQTKLGTRSKLSTEKTKTEKNLLWTSYTSNKPWIFQKKQISINNP